MVLLGCNRRLIASQPIFAHRNPVPSLCAGSTGGDAIQSVLCHLATVLIEGLRVRHPQMLAPAAFVQQLVVSRYTPLLHDQMSTAESPAVPTGDKIATAVAEADQVLDSVLTYFQELHTAMLDDGRS
eukprot:COSAG02_NODE_12841_length_1484_cov_1.373285_1_plen_126_part_10